MTISKKLTTFYSLHRQFVKLSSANLLLDYHDREFAFEILIKEQAVST